MVIIGPMELNETILIRWPWDIYIMLLKLTKCGTRYVIIISKGKKRDEILESTDQSTYNPAKSMNSDIDKETRKESENKSHSAEFLLSVLQKEYANELDRVKSLETRTGMFLVFATALLAFLFGTLKLPSLYNIKINNVFESIPYVFVWEFAALAVITLISAIVFFIMVVSVTEYKRLTLDGFNKNNAAFDKEQIALALIVEFKFALSKNQETNNKKVKRLKMGTYLIITSLGFTVLCNIFLILINK